MSRDISIQCKSPQQIPLSRKPNIENVNPPRNTNDFIKQMKKRGDEQPLSIFSTNSQLREANSVLIDISRIDHNTSNNSIYEMKQPFLQCQHRSNLPSNCTTQRTNKCDDTKLSKPYIEDNMGMIFIQQQMLQLQNENTLLKKQLENQECQRLLFQQQLLQQVQSSQQPIVINNNLTAPDQQSQIISPKKFQKKTHSTQGIQTDKSYQDQSTQKINELNVSIQDNEKSILQVDISKDINLTHNKSTRDFPSQLKSNQRYGECIESTQTQQDQQQSIESLTFGTSLQSQNFSQIKQQQQNENLNSRKNSQIDMTQIQSIDHNINQNYSMHIQENRKSSQPSIRMEFNFNDENNQINNKSLADCFNQRRKTTHDRKISIPIQEEEQQWIINVKQRSKEEQKKLRQEMMQYGRNRKQINKSQTPQQQSEIKRIQSPLMERLALGQKAKVETKEMFALTKKNYENLPEVKDKKQQEEAKREKQSFLKERQNKLKQLDDKIKQQMKK